MATKRTQAQITADNKARKIADGLKEIRSLWAYPEDHADIRAAAARITAKTARKRATPPPLAAI